MAADAFRPDRLELELAGPNRTAAHVSLYLRSVVRRGELGPGDRLPAERQLAVTLGVSRDTVREALQELEQGGYLVRRRGTNGGAFVTDLDVPFADWRTEVLQDPSSFSDVWELRRAVEVELVRLAAVRRTAAELAAIEETNAALQASSTNAEFRRCDLLFHGQIAEAARNPRLASLMYASRGALFSPVEPRVRAARVRRAAEGHAAVIGAMRARDADAAQECMREHLQAGRAEMKKAIRSRS